MFSWRNDIWETSVEIPYWWRVTTQIWVVLLIGWIEFPTRHDQSESVRRSGLWRVISMESLRSFFRRHLAGKTLVALPNVGCFLKLITTAMWRISARLNIFLYPEFSEENENEYEDFPSIDVFKACFNPPGTEAVSLLWAAFISLPSLSIQRQKNIRFNTKT